MSTPDDAANLTESVSQQQAEEAQTDLDAREAIGEEILDPEATIAEEEGEV